MVREGFDYGAGPIPPSVIKGAGRDFVVRYVHPGKWTQMYAPEYAQLKGAGIDVCGVWQATKSRALEGGFDGGAFDMNEAMNYVVSIGGPATAVIYIVANDYGTLNATQLAAVKRYMDGAVAARGHALTGAYGDYYTIDHLNKTNTCKFYWQTRSWSNGLWHSKSNLQQYVHDTPVSGYNVDYTRAMTVDFGQWSIGRTGCTEPIFEELFGVAGC